MNMQVEIIGREHISPLALFGASVGRVIGPAVQKGSQVLRDTAKTLSPVSAKTTGYGAKGIPVAPKHGGFMRQNIGNRKLSLLAAGVHTGRADYGAYVHQVTRKMPARPFFEWAAEVAESRIDDIMLTAFSKLVNGK